MREKRGHCPRERRQRLLDSGLFHLLWDRPGILDKVTLSIYFIYGNCITQCVSTQGIKHQLRDELRCEGGLLYMLRLPYLHYGKGANCTWPSQHLGRARSCHAAWYPCLGVGQSVALRRWCVCDEPSCALSHMCPWSNDCSICLRKTQLQEDSFSVVQN